MTPRPADDLDTLLGDAYWALSDEVGWIVGDLAGNSARVVDFGLDAVVVREPGGVIAWKRVETGFVFATIDPSSGRTLQQVALDTAFTHAAATLDRAGTTLYVRLGKSDYLDGGVTAIDLDSGAQQPIIQGSPSSQLARNWLKWSPSGETLVSNLCERETCSWYDVIYPARQDVVRVTGMYSVNAVGNDFMLARDRTDPAMSGWLLVALPNGETQRVAEAAIAWPAMAFALDDGRFLAAGVNGPRTEYSIVLIDPVTSEATLVYEAAWAPGESPELRVESFLDGRWAVLIPGPLTQALDRPTTSLDVLDLKSGSILPDRATFASP